MEFFVRAMEMHKHSPKSYSPELRCADLPEAKEQAKRQALEADPLLMLQVDACLRTNGHVVTKCRYSINRRGELHEYCMC